ncbi:pentatricopeptide repeat-containing protein At4g02750-like [Olea europaea var. sylvestris]|uniref:pentatricopeptide repeat-containing protein At4g02750-like n=1 Tax=Olea europaea var. sylvestris TaxID=158386 RepID=UPI000C1CE43A|nr:pentatricopeptide repeat-containing protein At4g02750-like [Olea europaea var. sylvestris]
MRLLRMLGFVLRTPSRHICTSSTVSLNQKINGYIRNGNLNEARKLFNQNPNSRNVISWNSMINGYIKICQIQQAQKLFDEMPQRDVVSWNTMLSGFRDSQKPQKAHQHFLEMMRKGPRPKELTFAVLISAFLNTKFDVLIQQLHCLVICSGLNLNVFLGSALMRGYIALGDCEGFCRVFDEILEKDVAPWNVLLLGYMEFGLINEAQRAFDAMPEKNAYSWSTLINGYAKNKKVNEAREAFNKLSKKDVVSWTAMIKGYVQGEKFVEALELFLLMMNSGTRPNHYTFSSVLDACAGCSSLVMGNEVHTCILKFGCPLDVILATSLVDMYAKCGDIDASCQIFESMLTKNLVSWNSIIGGYAKHGLATRASEEFERMVKSGVRPDEISFINLLSAFVHGGMVQEGEKIFNSMSTKYGIQAEMEHYASMVDLYGRAGLLEKAGKLIESMPFEPDVVVWGALLGACGLHSSLDLAEAAANGISKLQQDHPAVCSMLSKIYGENAVWGRVNELKKLMRKGHVRKQNAGSWIESRHVFI